MDVSRLYEPVFRRAGIDQRPGICRGADIRPGAAGMRDCARTGEVGADAHRRPLGAAGAGTQPAVAHRPVYRLCADVLAVPHRRVDSCDSGVRPAGACRDGSAQALHHPRRPQTLPPGNLLVFRRAGGAVPRRLALPLALRPGDFRRRCADLTISRLPAPGHGLPCRRHTLPLHRQPRHSRGACRNQARHGERRLAPLADIHPSGLRRGDAAASPPGQALDGGDTCRDSRCGRPLAGQQALSLARILLHPGDNRFRAVPPLRQRPRHTLRHGHELPCDGYPAVPGRRSLLPPQDDRGIPRGKAHPLSGPH